MNSIMVDVRCFHYLKERDILIFLDANDYKYYRDDYDLTIINPDECCVEVLTSFGYEFRIL